MPPARSSSRSGPTGIPPGATGEPDAAPRAQPASPARRVLPPDRRPPGSSPAGIVHLGLGNFHRAHQAVYTDAALTAEPGPWGIIGVANRSAAVVEALRAQQMLYTVVQISPEGYDFRVPDVHSDAFVAADEPDRLQDLLAAP